VVDITTGDHLEDPQAEDTIMVDTIMGDQSMADMDLPIVEVQNVDQDTIVVHMVPDQVDITLELAQGLDQTQGFWPEYWVEDPKLRMRIL